MNAIEVYQMATSRSYSVGDPVVFTATKRSAHPGPRAKDIAPEPMGEDYTYVVDKYWVVSELLPDGRLELRTRGGKRHILEADHPNLRHVNLWDKIRYRHKFPTLDGKSRPIES